MICESCGNENAMGNAFCTKCGSPLNNNQNNNQSSLNQMYNQNNNQSSLNQMYNQNNNQNMNQQMNNGIQMNMDNNQSMNNSMPMNMNNNQPNNGMQMNMNNNQPNNGMQMKFNNQNNQNNVDEKKLKDKKRNGMISLILSLVCIPLFFIISFLVLPICIIGLIFGIAAGKKGIAGIIINIIDIILAVVIALAAFYLVFTGGYKMYGTYHCMEYHDLYSEEDIKNFELTEKPYTFKINYDDTFSMEVKANDTLIEGTFKIIGEKTSEMYQTDYYNLKMDATKRRVAGKEYTEPFQTEYVFAIYRSDNNKNAAYIYNPKSMSQYICEKGF